MFYFVLIFFLLLIQKKTQPLFYPLLLALAIFPALFYLTGLTGIKIYHSIYLDVAATIIFAAFIVYQCSKAVLRAISTDKDICLNIIVITFFLVLFLWFYSKSFVLPLHDPIFAPSFGKLIFQNGSIPKTLSPICDDIYIYPPGLCIIVSVFYNFGNPFLVLYLYKLLIITAMALTPAIWAYFFRRIYRFDFIKSFYILTAFYYGFFLFDRTIILAPAFAGKGAIIFAAAVFPAIMYGFLRDNDTIRDNIVVILSIVGIILLHYSSLYMLSIFIFFHILADYRLYQKKIKNFILILLSSGFLFFPFYYSIHKSPSVVSFQIDSLSRIPAKLINLLFFANETLFWNFSGLGIKWPYKEILLLLFFLVLSIYYATVKFKGRQNDYEKERSVFNAGLTAFLSIIGIIVLISCLGGETTLTGAMETEVVTDTFRWFFYNFTALLGSVFFVFMCLVAVKTKKSSALKLFQIIYFIIIPTIYFCCCNDFSLVHKTLNAKKNQISLHELKELQSVLNLLTDDCECSLIIKSRSVYYHSLLAYEPLEYYSVISKCRILNGSFITRPFEGSRDVNGLPSAQFLKTFNKQPVYFICEEKTLREYLNAVDGITYEVLDYRVGNFMVYKLSGSR